MPKIEPQHPAVNFIHQPNLFSESWLKSAAYKYFPSLPTWGFCGENSSQVHSFLLLQSLHCWLRGSQGQQTAMEEQYSIFGAFSASDSIQGCLFQAGNTDDNIQFKKIRKAITSYWWHFLEPT